MGWAVVLQPLKVPATAADRALGAQTRTTAPAPSAGLVWSVQAGSFRGRPEAEALAGRLRSFGPFAEEEVWVRGEQVPGLGDWYRVWVGRYAGKEEGEVAADRIRRSGLTALALLRSTPAPLP